MNIPKIIKKKLVLTLVLLLLVLIPTVTLADETSTFPNKIGDYFVFLDGTRTLVACDGEPDGWNNISVVDSGTFQYQEQPISWSLLLCGDLLELPLPPYEYIEVLPEWEGFIVLHDGDLLLMATNAPGFNIVPYACDESGKTPVLSVHWIIPFDGLYFSENCP